MVANRELTLALLVAVTVLADFVRVNRLSVALAPGGHGRVPWRRLRAVRVASFRRDARHVHRRPGGRQRLRGAEGRAPVRGERVAKYNRLLEIAASRPDLPDGLANL